MYYSKNKNKSTTMFNLSKNFIIEYIKNDEMNNECFDCGRRNPEYISINNGIFLCNKCIYYHYKFPDVISTLIKNNLNILGKRELNFLYYGGNRKLSEFLFSNFPSFNKYQPDLLYKTDALKYYRFQLENAVNQKESEENRLFLSGEESYYPKTNQRKKLRNKNNSYKKNNLKIETNDDNIIYNDNNLKKKYNYRKIFLDKKYAFKNIVDNNQNSYRSEYNIGRKNYKKRSIPSHKSNTYKGSVDAYENMNNTGTFRQRRILVHNISNDSYLSIRKTLEQKNDIFNNKYDFDNSDENTNNSWMNDSNRKGKSMNHSYMGQNINYKNYINNTININSPNCNNIYYDFQTENNFKTKSPDINNFGYIANNGFSKYQTFYRDFNLKLPNKLIYPSQTSRSFALSSNRVYSKPKLPKYKINKRKIQNNKEISEKYRNYFTIKNTNITHIGVKTNEKISISENNKNKIINNKNDFKIKEEKNENFENIDKKSENLKAVEIEGSENNKESRDNDTINNVSVEKKIWEKTAEDFEQNIDFDIKKENNLKNRHIIVKRKDNEFIQENDEINKKTIEKNKKEKEIQENQNNVNNYSNNYKNSKNENKINKEKEKKKK
jgi:ADP-ribosylation factor GTPase-activating protein 1